MKVDKIKFDKCGLVPMIIKDSKTGAVLSLFYANKDAISRMLETGYVWRYSRSKKEVMKKGAVSGNIMKVASVAADCDGDAILVKVTPTGPACHTSSYSCFNDQKYILNELIEVIYNRKTTPDANSYTAKIVNSKDKIIEKLIEELQELVEAKKENDIKWEAADLIYFILVYLENKNVKFEDVLDELRRRRSEKIKERD